MKIVNKEWLLLLALVSLALVLRLFTFGEIPHGVNRDEASIGYTAYLLANTGQDEYGRHWPFQFQSFGDWKMPFYIYLTIPFVTVFGLTIQAVRLPSLLFSLVMVVAAYFLGNRLEEAPDRKRIVWSGLMAAAFLSINPWHFHFSQVALEPMVAASLFALGVLVLSWEKKYSPVGGFSLLLLSMATYHAALVFVPLWMLGFLLITRKQPRTTVLYASGLIFLILSGAIFYQAWFSAERDKVAGTTIFTMSHEQQWEKIYQFRSSPVSVLWANKYVYWAKTIGGNYFKTFTPTFLFNRGGTHPHYNVPGFGNFYILEILMAGVGVAAIIIKRKRLGYLVILAILLAPLPAAITRDAVHSTREIFFLPMVQIAAGYGLETILLALKNLSYKTGLVMALFAFMAVQAVPFFGYYFGQYRKDSDVLYTGYLKEVSLALMKYSPIYSTIYVTFPFESPYMFYAFYTAMKPNDFLTAVEYYPPDRWGFTHAKRLGNIVYPVDKYDLSTVSKDELADSLIVSRVEEVGQELLVESWDNLTGEKEVVAYEPRLE